MSEPVRPRKGCLAAAGFALGALVAAVLGGLVAAAWVGWLG